MTTRYCLRSQLGMCTGRGAGKSDEAVYLVDDEGRKLALVFDCVACVMEVIAQGRE
jgi:hypothetical protein